MDAFAPDTEREWLEADGLGGFASGTVSTIRTRRYHALLLTAETPPSDRWVLVNGVEAWLEINGHRYSLTSQSYGGAVVHPDGVSRIRSFRAEPWPTWTYRVDDADLTHEVFAVFGQPATVLRWTGQAMPGPVRLFVRLLMSGRDPHQLHHASDGFEFGVSVDRGRFSFTSYPGVPPVHVATTARYTHAPEWYRNFFYRVEAERGLDNGEDLASPGVFEFDLSNGPASLVLSSDPEVLSGGPVETLAEGLVRQERSRREKHPDALARAAESYVVKRGNNLTVIAGYPWFGDWGRDTFIALRGLRHLPNGPQRAEAILTEWATVVSKGMLPNRFPDRGDEPEYNSVDASLWYVLAVRDHMDSGRVEGAVATELMAAVTAILDGYASGTRFGIRADADGLLRAGVQGVQLTWMDAKVGDWVVTPRIGKPVEVQALWLNALDFAQRHDSRFEAPLRAGLTSFRERFDDPSLGHLLDVVDVDHEPGRIDGRFRPNQVLALGGLPLSLVDRQRSRAILDRVEDVLWTPMGLRSLAPGEAQYVARYEGGVRERDGAYHQGTVWPWLTGPFVDAWVWSRGGGVEVEREARRRFVTPLFGHLQDAGLGHVSEIADAASPHVARGAPFQAWSVTELLRLDRTLAQ